MASNITALLISLGTTLQKQRKRSAQDNAVTASKQNGPLKTATS